jgi:polyisoprenoid-binding protein YceI
MKKFFFLLTLLSGMFIACQSGSSNEAATTTTETEAPAEATATAISYTVNTSSSVINWEGYKPGKYGHVGTIKLQGGTINAKDGLPESGNFTIDVASLESTDLAETPDKKLKLEGHLKSGDFFEVEKYPTGKFEMTGIAPLADNAEANYTIKGNLTLKETTKGIEIPAKVTMNEGSIMVTTPEFTINRTEWGVNFGSGVIGTIKDQMIADDVKLKINLVANAQVAEQ